MKELNGGRRQMNNLNKLNIWKVDTRPKYGHKARIRNHFFPISKKKLVDTH